METTITPDTSKEMHSTYVPEDALFATWVKEAACYYAECGKCKKCFDELQASWQAAKAAGSSEGCWAFNLAIEVCGNALVKEFGGTFE